jgi:hypothetical protein
MFLISPIIGERFWRPFCDSIIDWNWADKRKHNRRHLDGQSDRREPP